MLKAYIEFRVPQLFVDEVKAEQAEIEDNVVRVTTLRKRDRGNPHLVQLYLVVTAIRGDHLLRLMAPMGAFTGDKKKDEALEKKSEKQQADLARDLEDLCMDVRHGGYIDPVREKAA